MFKEIFPPIETALDMEPEELAPFVLKHLKKIGKINRHNYTLGTSGEIKEYAGEQLGGVKKDLWKHGFGLSEKCLLLLSLGKQVVETR